jgi:hypothetical protein
LTCTADIFGKRRARRPNRPGLVRVVDLVHDADQARDHLAAVPVDGVRRDLTALDPAKDGLVAEDGLEALRQLGRPHDTQAAVVVVGGQEVPTEFGIGIDEHT